MALERRTNEKEAAVAELEAAAAISVARQIKVCKAQACLSAQHMPTYELESASHCKAPD